MNNDNSCIFDTLTMLFVSESWLEEIMLKRHLRCSLALLKCMQNRVVCLNIVDASIFLVCAILNIPLALVLMIWIMDIFDNFNLDLMNLKRQILTTW